MYHSGVADRVRLRRFMGADIGRIYMAALAVFRRRFGLIDVAFFCDNDRIDDLGSRFVNWRDSEMFRRQHSFFLRGIIESQRLRP